MKRIMINGQVDDMPERSCACIGYFDGLHLGHQALIEKTKELAVDKDCLSCVICFSPDPFEVISSEKHKHIYPESERYYMIEKTGIDQVIVIGFDEKLMHLDHLSFINSYLDRLNISDLVCGYDFTFGHLGQGNGETLERYGDFTTHIIPAQTYQGKKISSTLIREKISCGDLESVKLMTGANYHFLLKIVKCVENGPGWFTEAIRLDEDTVMIPDGEYGDLRVAEGCFVFHSDEYLPEGSIYRLYI